MTDYEKWKAWLNQWNFKYEEKECDSNILKCLTFNGCINVIFEKATGRFLNIYSE